LVAPRCGCLSARRAPVVAKKFDFRIPTFERRLRANRKSKIENRKIENAA
jgi:hypothetical protein